MNTGTRQKSWGKKKPYSYRGISDFVDYDTEEEDEDIWDCSNRSQFREERTLTSDSKLSFVIKRGYQSKRRRDKGADKEAEPDIQRAKKRDRQL